MIPQIQRLTSADVASLRALNALFSRAFEDPDTYEAMPPDDDYLRKLLGLDHVIALVAIHGKDVIGGLVAYELQKFERARREIYIFDLGVDEPFRRQGVATALLQRLREIAAERQAWVVYVQADYGDEPAIALYQKLGVREDVMHFDLTPLPLKE